MAQLVGFRFQPQHQVKSSVVLTPVIPALERRRQEKQQFLVFLGYLRSELRPAALCEILSRMIKGKKALIS